MHRGSTPTCITSTLNGVDQNLVASDNPIWHATSLVRVHAVTVISALFCASRDATRQCALSTGIASNAAIDWLGSSSRATRLPVTSHEGTDMLNPQKTLEREALLKRIRELDAEIAQHEGNLRELEAQVPN